jgi:hypothetical protein
VGSDAEEVASPPPTIQDLDLFGDETPEALRHFDGAPEFKIGADELAKLDPTARRILHNFRTNYLKKTAALAEERRRIEATQSTFEKSSATQIEELAKARARLIEMFDDPRIKKYAEPPADPAEPLDPWTPEGQRHAIEAAVAEHMKKFLGEFSALGEEEKKKVESIRAENAKTERRNAVRAFAEAHPDFMEMKDRIVEYRSKYGNALPAEEVYEILKAKDLAAGRVAEKENPRLASVRAASRPSRASEGSGRGLPDNWREMSGREKVEWWDAHPNEAAAAAAKMRLGA